ncbi:MAG: hypothetical protein KAU35_00935, partial [candidate division Zixibacteria bacterium]|nr:hypothetical protein [candidate division Zixibacteria bacterium]
MKTDLPYRTDNRVENRKIKKETGRWPVSFKKLSRGRVATGLMTSPLVRLTVAIATAAVAAFGAWF